MRLLPRSLAGRLLGISALTTLAALAFAAFGIGHVLERFVMRGLDQQLDTQVAMLARAVRPDGTLDPARIVNLPMFESAGDGWGWRVQGGRGVWTGGDAITDAARPGPDPIDDERRHRGPGRRGAMPDEGATRSGERVHMRRLDVPTDNGVVTVVASGPRRLVLAPLREAMVPLIGSLAILGLALALAILLQLRFGLRPLRTLQASLAAVRAGRARHVPVDQPDELAPLATELNALIDQNEAQLGHARRHVANLAHGLKTPLAALGVRLAEDGRDPDGSLAAMLADIDGRVRHHLGRARAATPGGRSRARTALAPAIADLVAVMEKIHAGRSIAVTIDVPPDMAAAMDGQDVDEMLGNLIDNGWRHARTAIAITAMRDGQTAVLTIEDDGPGLSAQAIGEALVPGRRLDERGDGHGFGLPIAQELAELNGGGLTLTRSTVLGGLCVRIVLPAGS